MTLFSRLSTFFQTWFSPQIRLLWLVTLWLMLFDNLALVQQLNQLFPWNGHQAGLLASLCVFFTGVTMLWLLLIAHGKHARWLLATIVFTSAIAGFYMHTYSIIIDTVMLNNLLSTDHQEILGLLSWQMCVFVSLFGVLPALWLVWKAPAHYFVAEPFRRRLAHVGGLSLVLLVCVLPQTAGYASFIREHKLVRMYANPTFTHYSLLKWSIQQMAEAPIKTMTHTAQDATHMVSSQKHELIIMVVGETARYDRFALNGYHRPTNPRLSQEQVVSFAHVASCGTSTGVSVPCMFSRFGRKHYNPEIAKHTENALDVLHQQGVSVLWRDNNSDSKGVAVRLPYENFQSPTLNPTCDTECRDIGMLSGLGQYIAKHRDQDIMIVLHQMGNHGPEYYRRYPKAFEQFKPVCRQSDLSQCTQAEIDNAYDNAILYTDYFLSEVIKLLKRYDDSHETAMLYVADHGESLGEHGFYLHAAPYMMAPKEQTHVPAILWLGQHFDYQLSQVQPYKASPLSHDDLFCTLLTAYELKSEVCHAKFNWLYANADVRAQWHAPVTSAARTADNQGLAMRLAQPNSKPAG